MYNNYIDVIVSIKNLIIAYKIRNEEKIVEGLEMALRQVLQYKDVQNIFERDDRFGKKHDGIYFER